MNTKVLATLSILILVLLVVSYSWNSNAKKPQPALRVSTLNISQGNMAASQSVAVDDTGKVTATLVSGGGAPQTKTGTLTEDQRSGIIAATLTKYHATTLTSDPTPPPDATASVIDFTIADKKYELRCNVTGSDCSKLADELFADFASILSHQ